MLELIYNFENGQIIAPLTRNYRVVGIFISGKKISSLTNSLSFVSFKAERKAAPRVNVCIHVYSKAIESI
jgi:hypothetical protein